MDRLKRGTKLYLDRDNIKESAVNQYLACRDGVVEMYEYRDCSGYGTKTRLYLCQDTKHEHVNIIRQTEITQTKEWDEEVLMFDTDSFCMLEALIKRDVDCIYGDYKKLRDYDEKK